MEDYSSDDCDAFYDDADLWLMVEALDRAGALPDAGQAVELRRLRDSCGLGDEPLDRLPAQLAALYHLWARRLTTDGGRALGMVPSEAEALLRPYISACPIPFLRENARGILAAARRV